MMRLILSFSGIIFTPVAISQGVDFIVYNDISKEPELYQERDLSQARDFAITYAGWSWHLGSNNRNQDNYIVGVRYKEMELSTMINSFNHRAYIVSYHKKWFWKDWVDVGLRVGGITGYTKEENSFQFGGITPVFAPTIDFHYKNMGFETALFTDVVIFSLNVAF